MPDVSQAPQAATESVDEIVSMTIPADPIPPVEDQTPTPPLVDPIAPQEEAAVIEAEEVVEDNRPPGVPHPDYKPVSGHNSTNPCMFCTNKEKYIQPLQEYMDKLNGDKPFVPYKEELAIKMGIHSETLLEWGKKAEFHPEITEALKTVEDYQKLRLQQRVMGRYNPTGAIFLLKANHKFIETEKQILAGDRSEPVQIEIVEEVKRLPDNE